ncbi:MAG: FapA family protein [Candidatus Latescibacterota bacterium]|jgi:hypothetical protein
MPRKDGKKGRGPSRPSTDPLLAEVDRFLEHGGEAVSPGVLKHLEESEQRTRRTQPPGASRPAGPPVAPSAPASTSAAPATRPPAAPEPPPSEPIDVDLSEDGMTATVAVVKPRHTSAQILAALTETGVVFGVEVKAIKLAVRTARQTNASIRRVVVAKGMAPVPPVAPRLEYQLPAGLQTPPSLEPVQQALARKSREEVGQAAAGLVVWSVNPGDPVAMLRRDVGTVGTDVEGNVVPIPEEETPPAPDPLLIPGSGVSVDDAGTTYHAAGHGYAGTLAGQVAVLPPVWIAADELEACYLSVPRHPGCPTPTAVQLRSLLESLGVTAGIDDQQLGVLVEEIGRGLFRSPLVSVARGQAPVPPREAVPQFVMDLGVRVGLFRPDGSVDFKDRNLFPGVTKDVVLAEYTPPEAGTAGRTVRGKEIAVPPPGTASLAAGANVQLEEREGVQRLIATADGAASLAEERRRDAAGALATQYTVAVQEVAEVGGDVGYQTGHLEVKGSVAIQGSVCTGFRVKASGSVAIKESVEPGARIEAGGEVTVGFGIVGRDTVVEAGTSVTAKFVQEARITAGTDIRVGSYSHGAVLKATGRVEVEGAGGSGGGIVGGETWAVQQVISRNLGSELSQGTLVFVGIGPDQHARCEQARRAAQQAEAMLGKVLKAIGLSALEPGEIRRLIGRNPARRQVLVHYLKKAHQLSQIRDQQRQQHEELLSQVAGLAAAATIEVSEQAFARTRVQIGSVERVLLEDLKKVRFRLDPEAGEVVWADL